MKCTLPTVTRVGHFDSREKLPGISQTSPRVVEIYELEMFSSDSGTAYYNGEVRQVQKGDIMVAKPGSTRWSILPVRCFFVHFTTDDPELIRFLEELNGFCRADNYGAIEVLFRSIYSAFTSVDVMAPSLASARVLELLWQLHMHGKPSGRSSGKNPIPKAIRIIQRDFREDISVEQLAEKCNLSVSYFHKLFVQYTGSTPNRYLTNTRLTAAKAMLMTSNQSVAQIAECCGFSSQGYFCDCMKKYTGMSPRQFRNTSNYPEDI